MGQLGSEQSNSGGGRRQKGGGAARTHELLCEVIESADLSLADEDAEAGVDLDEGAERGLLLVLRALRLGRAVDRVAAALRATRT